jgi:hypothetical protein
MSDREIMDAKYGHKKDDFIKDEGGNIKTKSPFTDDLDVIVEYDDKNGESRMCMVTGYTTSERYKFDSELIEKIENSNSKFIKEMRYEDRELEQYWYLTTITTSQGIVYPEGTKDHYEWVFSPIVKLTEEEKKEYPIPGKENEYYETRVGIEHSQRFQSNNFLGACKSLGAVIGG